jgi:hypothetical protein
MMDVPENPKRGASVAGRPFIDAVIEPGACFASPEALAEDPRLSREEKRLILISWAQYVLEALQDGGAEARFREAVLQQLAQLDPVAAEEYAAAFVEAARNAAPAEVAAH